MAGQNWWENEPLAGPAQGVPGYIPGRPKAISPAEQQRLDLSIRADARATDASARAAAAADRAARSQERQASVSERTAGNMNYDNVSKMRTEFTGRKEVANFTTILPMVSNAMKIAMKPAQQVSGGDDLSLIYTFGKVMDPGSVVREGELALASETGSFAQNLEAAAQKLRSGAKLPPEVRTKLVEAMRQRGADLAHSYNQTRKSYQGLAQRNGFRPEDVVLEHPAAPFQQVEADFTHKRIGNLDGSLGSVPRGTVAVKSVQDAMRLPKGTVFYTPDGRRKVR